MYKLLFVVHRYPLAGCGGSEYNVQRLAEEALRQGHDVTVLAGENTGNLNGVKVTAELHILTHEKWDMIFVHGSCPTQDVVHANAHSIDSPIYYLLVEPPKTGVAMHGIEHAKWIGWGTSVDYAFIKDTGVEEKAHKFFYGIEDCMGDHGFKERYNISTPKMFLSVGGFWPHKRHTQLAEAFRETDRDDTTLVLMGYDNRHGTMPKQSANVAVIMGADKRDIYDAMWEADLYILNSESEGYGLVLLEAMWNLCPWIATDIAAAHDLAALGYGKTYTEHQQLVELLRSYQLPFSEDACERLTLAEQYVMQYHTIEHSVRNLLSVLA